MLAAGGWEAQQEIRLENFAGTHCLALYLDPDACECLPEQAAPDLPDDVRRTDDRMPAAEKWWLGSAGRQCPFNPLREPRDGDAPAAVRALRRNARASDLLARRSGLLRWIKRLRDLHRIGRLPDDLAERDFIILGAVLDWTDSPRRDRKPEKPRERERKHQPRAPRRLPRPTVIKR